MTYQKLITLINSIIREQRSWPEGAAGDKLDEQLDMVFGATLAVARIFFVLFPLFFFITTSSAQVINQNDGLIGFITKPTVLVNYPPHMDTARSYVGTTETSHNRGPEVERFLSSVGLGPGNPWCAAFVSYTLDVAQPNPKFPEVRSGLASHFIVRGEAVDARRVMSGEITPRTGWLVIWRRGETQFGHVGEVEHWHRQKGRTVEGNTSSGVHGNQADGGGVWRRERSIHPGSYFRITHFLPVRYCDG